MTFKRVEIATPEPTPILELHRGGDGFICFAPNGSLGANDFKTFAIRADELRGFFPAIRHHLTTDAAFSINGFWTRKRWKSRLDPGLVRVSREADNLRYLNACFIDLDGHKLGLSFGDLIGVLTNAVDAGTIPQPSVIADSGRGAWAFWMLNDAELPNLPQRAFREKLDL